MFVQLSLCNIHNICLLNISVGSQKVCFELDFEFYFLFFLQTAKPPVFGPCRLLDFELEMVGQQENVNLTRLEEYVLV